MNHSVMTKLFEVYYEQCPKAKIRYALYDDSRSQGHIVLDEGIEICHLKDGSITFAFARDNQEYLYDTYDAAVITLDITEGEWEKLLFIQNMNV